MTSIKEVQDAFDYYQAEWNDLRPFLVRYLPGRTARLNKADRLMADTLRYLGNATQAGIKHQRLRAFWWYGLFGASMRDHNKLMDELGESGLQAQAKANKLHKKTMSQNSG